MRVRKSFEEARHSFNISNSTIQTSNKVSDVSKVLPNLVWESLPTKSLGGNQFQSVSQSVDYSPSQAKRQTRNKSFTRINSLRASKLLIRPGQDELMRRSLHDPQRYILNSSSQTIYAPYENPERSRQHNLSFQVAKPRYVPFVNERTHLGQLLIPQQNPIKAEGTFSKQRLTSTSALGLDSQPKRDHNNLLGKNVSTQKLLQINKAQAEVIEKSISQAVKKNQQMFGGPQDEVQVNLEISPIREKLAGDIDVV
jgi:hypothetical protein